MSERFSTVVCRVCGFEMRVGESQIETMDAEVGVMMACRGCGGYLQISVAALREGLPPVRPDVGYKANTCPVCGRSFIVTPLDDVLWPACGCYDDAPAGSIPCERCGIEHASGCPGIPSGAL